MPIYKTYCRDTAGKNAHHTSVVADDPREAARLGLGECRFDWGWGAAETDKDNKAICVGVMDMKGAPILWEEDGIDVPPPIGSAPAPKEIIARRVVATLNVDLRVPAQYDEQDIMEITFDIPLGSVMVMVEGKATEIEVLGYTTTETEIVEEERA